MSRRRIVASSNRLVASLVDGCVAPESPQGGPDLRMALHSHARFAVGKIRRRRETPSARFADGEARIAISERQSNSSAREIRRIGRDARRTRSSSRFRERMQDGRRHNRASATGRESRRYVANCARYVALAATFTHCPLSLRHPASHQNEMRSFFSRRSRNCATRPLATRRSAGGVWLALVTGFTRVRREIHGEAFADPRPNQISIRLSRNTRIIN